MFFCCLGFLSNLLRGKAFVYFDIDFPISLEVFLFSRPLRWRIRVFAISTFRFTHMSKFVPYFLQSRIPFPP